jgi:hypothetical protein
MRLLGAILKAKVLSGHPQHLRERPCIGPVPHERVGRTCLTDQGFSRRYEISYRGVKLPRVSAASSALLAAVRGRFAAGGH